MPNKGLYLAQLMHPGTEHGRDHGIWNQREPQCGECDHKRKFMRGRGSWFDGLGESHGELLFWGEWEPPSDAEDLNHGLAGFPKYLHHPYICCPQIWGEEENTDPFVFGEQFLYTTCLQKENNALHDLTDGSIILFGSHQDDKFVLDTVFVVSKSIEHTHTNYQTILRNEVPCAYFPITLDRLYSNQCDKELSWRLYKGASFKDRASSNGMFSYVPSKPAVGKVTQGFPRPYLTGAEYVNSGLMRNHQLLVNLTDLDQAADVWRKISAKVVEQGCNLGVHVELPPTRMPH